MVVIVIASVYDLHADSIVFHLSGVTRVFRFDPLNELKNLSFVNGKCCIGGCEFFPDEITGVYCRYALDYFGSQKTGNQILDFSHQERIATFIGILSLIPLKKWMNWPWNERIAEGKIYPLIAAKNEGLNVPKFIVTSNGSEIRQFAKNRKCIIKPLSDEPLAFQGGEFVKVPDFNEFYSPYTADFIDDNFEYDDTPCLIQEKILKKTEIRVVCIDGKCFATSVNIDETHPVDSRLIKQRNENKFDLPTSVAIGLSNLVKNCLTLRISTMDMVIDAAGVFYLLDVNPQGNWLWQEGIFDFELSKNIATGLMNFRE
jgi:hypothetical protein